MTVILSSADFHPRSFALEDLLFLERHCRRRPAVDPFCSARWKIDAAMAPRAAEIVVPVRPVERDTIFIDEAHPGNAWQVERICCGVRAVDHVARGPFVIRKKSAFWGKVAIPGFQARSAAHHLNRIAVLVGNDDLVFKAHLDVLLICGHVWRKGRDFILADNAHVSGVDVEFVLVEVFQDLIPGIALIVFE